MNLNNSSTFLVFCVTVLFATHFTLWNHSEEKTAYSFTVKIPKEFNTNFTNEEFANYVFEGNSVSKSELEKRKNLSLVANCGILIISIERDKTLKLNSEKQKDLHSLIIRLKDIFDQREEINVFEPNGEYIYKTVVIKSNLSNKYGDVMNIIDAVKGSGADPIILQIDHLPK